MMEVYYYVEGDDKKTLGTEIVLNLLKSVLFPTRSCVSKPIE